MKIPNYILITILVSMTIAPLVHAEESSKPIDLAKLQLGDQAQLVNEDGQNLIRIKTSTSSKSQDILLFDLDKPDIKQNAYALAGEVRYEDVAGKSYLETWNHFVSEQGSDSVPSKYFTRGLNPTGPMGVLSGKSDWRAFQLPFFINTDDASLKGPNKITLNLHLEGAGLVEIRNVKLVDGLKGKPITPQEALHQEMRPTWGILIGILLFGAVPLVTIAIVVTIIVVVLRRKKRTADELRRIQASDV